MGGLAIIAIGGNSLIKDKDHKTVEDQYRAICETAVHIVDIIEMGYDVVLTHGNGPQVGNIPLASEAAKDTVPLMPLDICGAATQRTMGFMIQNTLLTP